MRLKFIKGVSALRPDCRPAPQVYVLNFQSFFFFFFFCGDRTIHDKHSTAGRKRDG